MDSGCPLTTWIDLRCVHLFHKRSFIEDRQLTTHYAEHCGIQAMTKTVFSLEQASGQMGLGLECGGGGGGLWWGWGFPVVGVGIPVHSPALLGREVDYSYQETSL